MSLLRQRWRLGSPPTRGTTSRSGRRPWRSPRPQPAARRAWPTSWWPGGRTGRVWRRWTGRLSGLQTFLTECWYTLAIMILQLLTFQLVVYFGTIRRTEWYSAILSTKRIILDKNITTLTFSLLYKIKIIERIKTFSIYESCSESLSGRIRIKWNPFQKS